MKYTRTLLLFVLVFTFFSCNRKDRIDDIKTIDQKLVEIDEAEKAFQTIDLDLAKTQVETILKEIKYLDKNYTDTMPKEEAIFWTKYKNVSKLLKNLNHTVKEINLEIPRTKNQLINLKKVITSHATEDKNGNAIDDLYIDKAIKEEMLYAKQILNQIKQLQENCTIVNDKFSTMKPNADKYMTALQLKMNENN